MIKWISNQSTKSSARFFSVAEPYAHLTCLTKYNILYFWELTVLIGKCYRSLTYFLVSYSNAISENYHFGVSELFRIDLHPWKKFSSAPRIISVQVLYNRFYEYSVDWKTLTGDSTDKLISVILISHGFTYLLVNVFQFVSSLRVCSTRPIST